MSKSKRVSIGEAQQCCIDQIVRSVQSVPIWQQFNTFKTDSNLFESSKKDISLVFR